MRTPLFQQIAPWLFVIPLAACALMVYGLPLAASNDLYLHLKIGQWITHSGQLGTERFSYTTQSGDEVQSWLAQMIFWIFYRIGGVTGLKLLHVALLGGSLYFFFRYVLEKTGRPVWASFTTLLVLALHQRFPGLHPRLFGELFFAGLVFWMLTEPQHLLKRHLGLLWGGVALWANLHESAILALPVLGIYPLFAQRSRQEKVFSRLWLAPIGAGLALCLNPVGWRIYPRTFEMFSAGKLSLARDWENLIPFRWEPAFPPPTRIWIGLDFESIVLYLSFATAGWILFRAPQRRRSELGYLMLLSVLSISLALWVAGYSFCLMTPLALFAVTLGNRRIAWVGLLDRLHLSRVLTPAFLLIATLFVFRFHETRVAGESIENAARFLKEANVKGNVLAPTDWGNYLAYANGPELKVALDSRWWLRRDHLDWLYQTRLQFGRIELVDLLKRFPETDLVMTKTTPLGLYLGPDWKVIYENNEATVLLRDGEKNQMNLHSVQAYYQQRSIPFDSKSGFVMGQALAAAPLWVQANVEQEDWGEWPDATQRDRRLAQTEAYLRQRQLSSIQKEP